MILDRDACEVTLGRIGLVEISLCEQGVLAGSGNTRALLGRAIERRRQGVGRAGSSAGSHLLDATRQDGVTAPAPDVLDSVS